MIFMTMLTHSLNQSNHRQYLSGIMLMLLSSVFVALSSLLGKQLLLSLALPIVMLLRYLFPALILWWFAVMTTYPHFDKRHIMQHSVRALLGVLSQYALFYYLMYGSILDATLLFMTTPLFVPLISRILLKSPIQKSQWISIVIGFVGVAFVLQPTNNILNWHAMIGLASGLFNAGSQVYYHKIMKDSDIKSATLMMYTFSTLLAFIPVIIFWHPFINLLSSLTIHNIQVEHSSYVLLLISLAMVSISNKTFRGKAYRKVNNATSLTPFLYMAIIFAGLLDWLVYNITPTYLSIAGAVLIISSGFIVYFNQSKQQI